MTTDIEPTEGQREAAAIHTFGLHSRRPDVIAWVRTGQASGLSDIIVGVELEQARYLARTFAEREYKLTKDRDACAFEIRRLLARESERIFALGMIRSDLDAARLRIEELESERNDLTAQNNRLHAANAVLARERSEAVLGMAEPVPVEEQGWVVWDSDPSLVARLPWCTRDGWFRVLDANRAFTTKQEAQEKIDSFGEGNQTMRVLTLAEARAIQNED